MAHLGSQTAAGGYKEAGVYVNGKVERAWQAAFVR